jgi:drug/metabolite transporter (DMT)-like permease
MTVDGLKKLTIVAAFAAIYLFWGSTYLAIRIGLESLPPFLLAGARFLVAGGVLYTVLRLKGVPRPTDAQWWWAVVNGVMMLAGGAGGVTWAEQWVPSGPACLLIATVPMWMTLLDAAGRRTWPRWQVVLGLVLGMAGLAVLIGTAGSQLGGIDRLGAVVILIAALSWSAGSLASRAANLPESPSMTVAVQMVTAGVVLTALSGGLGEWQGLDPAMISSRSLVALVYLIVIGSMVSLSAYVWLLRQVSASAVATYAFVNPVVAVYLGWLLAQEVVGPRIITATTLIVAAVVLIQSAGWRWQRSVTTAAPLRLPAAPAPCPAVATQSTSRRSNC